MKFYFAFLKCLIRSRYIVKEIENHLGRENPKIWWKRWFNAGDSPRGRYQLLRSSHTHFRYSAVAVSNLYTVLQDILLFSDDQTLHSYPHSIILNRSLKLRIHPCNLNKYDSLSTKQSQIAQVRLPVNATFYSAPKSPCVWNVNGKDSSHSLIQKRDVNDTAVCGIKV